MIKEGLLEADGKFASEDKLQEFITVYTPQYPSTIAKAEPKFRHCMTSSGICCTPIELHSNSVG